MKRLRVVFCPQMKSILCASASAPPGDSCSCQSGTVTSEAHEAHVSDSDVQFVETWAIPSSWEVPLPVGLLVRGIKPRRIVLIAGGSAELATPAGGSYRSGGGLTAPAGDLQPR